MKSAQLRVIGLFSLVMILSGCSEPPADVPAQSTQPKTVSSISVGLEPANTAIPVSPSGVIATPPINTGPKPLAGDVATDQTLHTINTFLIEYQANGGKVPDSVEAMVLAKIIPPVPPAPAGKRFSVDTKKALVSFSDI